MLAYTDNGHQNKTTIVLLHGFCESKEIWGRLPIQLAEIYRVICIDLPGFGESTEAELVPDISDFADKVHLTLLEIGVKNVIMIGHSLGGYVTLAYAEKYRLNLSGIGLFHSTSAADNEEKKENRQKVAQFVLENGSEKFIPQLFAGLFSDKNKEKLALQIQLITDQYKYLTLPASIANASLAMRNRPDRSEILQKSGLPTLFIIGEDDKVIPLEVGIAQSKLAPNATVHILKETAHMGMIEAPEESLSIIKNFAKICV
jgi:pimeloyl-ACP methyl ester carboxylesterase